MLAPDLALYYPCWNRIASIEIHYKLLSLVKEYYI